MRMFLRFFVITILFITFLGITSCIKDNFDFDKWDKEVDYNGSFALPLAWGDLSFSEISGVFGDKSYIVENEQGFMSLVYRTIINSIDVHQIMDLTNQSLSVTIPSAVIDFSGFNVLGDAVSITRDYDMPFQMFNDDAMIDSIISKAGNLSMDITSTFNHTVDIVVTFPSIKKNGNPISFSFTYTPFGGTKRQTVDFSGYKIDLTKTSLGYNEIPIKLDITFFNSGGVTNGEISFNIDMSGIKYSRMHGYFGQNTLMFQKDSISVSLFKSDVIDIERYRFEDPKFSVYYKNSYGIPSQFYFTELLANSSIDRTQHDILSYGSRFPLGETNPVDISYATRYGEVALDSIKISKENSNIADIVNKRPNWIKFTAKAITNPGGIANRNNFIVEDSKLEADIVIEFPLWGYIYNFKTQDTSKVDFPSTFKKYDPLKRAMLRVEIDNGFPFEMYSQVYLADANYVILDSLLNGDSQQLLLPAEVDNNGRVTNFSKKVSKIECNERQISKLGDTKYLIYKIWASTAGAESNKVIKIYKDYRAKFYVGAEVDVKVQGNIDSISNSF